MKKLLTLCTGVALASTAMMSTIGCGGGGSFDPSNITVRPLTLDGVTLAIGSVTFDFNRSLNTPEASDIGDTEVGSVTFDGDGQVDQFNPNSANSITVSVEWPTSVSQVSYVYTAVNASSGTIQVIHTGAPTFLAGATGNTNQQHSYFDINESFTMVVSFIDDSGFISPQSTVVLNDDDDPTVNRLGFISSSTITEGAFTLTEGGPLPIGFTAGELNDENAVSAIASESISGDGIVFIDSVTVDNNFDLQFAGGASFGATDFDEVGNFTFTDTFADTISGVGGYSYTRINGSDDAELILDASPEEGTIILTFTSASGEGNQGGGTYVSTGTGNTGEFFVTTPDDLDAP